MPVSPEVQLAADNIAAKMFEGISGVKSGSEISADENMSIAILGAPKAGKSWLAASLAPALARPLFVADFDNRKDSLIGKPNLYAKTYVDTVQVRPTAQVEFDTDVERFKYHKINGTVVPGGFVLDSMTYMKKIAENEFFKQSMTGKVKMFREVKVGGDAVRIPEGWDAINGVREYMLYVISELRAMGHVIAIFHERPIVDKTLSTQERTVYTGEIGVDPPFLNNLLSVFNCVWRIRVDDNGKYKVWTRTTKGFNGASSLKGLALEEDPNIAAMLDKHKMASK